MRLSIQAITALFFLALGAIMQAPTQTGGNETLLGDKPFGTETYTLTTNADGTVQSVSDVAFGPTKMRATTVFTRNRPLSFTLETDGVKSLVEQFTGDGIKITAPGQPQKEIKSQPGVLLENGVWHHFIFLLAQYDAASGGKQSFNAFLPSQALSFKMSLERLDAPSFQVGGQMVPTEHFRAGTDLGLSFEIWTDSARIPLFILAQSGNKQVLLRIFPNLTHLFTPSNLDKTVTDAQTEVVSSDLLDLLQAWTTNVLIHGRDGGAVPEIK